MRLETKFTLIISAVVTLLLGFGVALAPSALGDVRAWGPSFMVVSAATAFLCARRLVSMPTQEMARKMWQIADTKSCDKPLCDEASRADHLALPARAFNHLLETTSDIVKQLRGEKTEIESRLGTLESDLQSARNELARSQEARDTAERSAAQAQEQTRSLQQRAEAAENACQIASQRSGFVVLSSPAPVFTMDTEGTVRSWNAAAERIFGWTAGECIGRPPVIVPEEEDGNEDLVGQLLDGRSFAGVEAVAEKKDGSVVSVTLDVAPARDAAAKVCELVVVVSGRAVGSAIASAVAERRVIDAKEPADVQAQISPAAECAVMVEVAGSGSVSISECATESRQSASQPIMKLCKDENDDCEISAEEASDENAATLVETYVETASESEVESETSAAAAQTSVYPRAASEWPKEPGIFLEPDEELIFDGSDETQVVISATKSKSRRGSTRSAAKKVVRKAAKVQRAKSRTAVTKRQRQVA